MEKSAIQNRIAYLYGQHVAPASRPEEEGETSYERMRARTQLQRAISERRKGIAEGADEATVKKLNSAVDEASRNARAAGYTPAGIARMISTLDDESARQIQANMLGRLLDDGDLPKLHQALLKKKPPAPSVRRRTAAKRRVGKQ